ncbi:hypothetical protein M404DRAFT_36395 [Pisolithus tinctorius Marx 270]|uniref:Uncharacterized protein n=1 Tax=Pisolithus tinctorius Marx 270 TaxID=870435 RepID=A0A0C3I7G2_PISTI|nr:hypothetical protein M404DRAFT_36395 [Pisolithus tinctorius Marx 270]
MAVTYDLTSAPQPKNGSLVRFGRVESSSSAPSSPFVYLPVANQSNTDLSGCSIHRPSQCVPIWCATTYFPLCVITRQPAAAFTTSSVSHDACHKGVDIGLNRMVPWTIEKLDNPWSVAPPDILVCVQHVINVCMQLRGELFVLKNFCQCLGVVFAEFAYEPQRKTSSSQAFSFIHDAASRHLPTASINDTAVAPLSERTPKTSISRSSHATYVDVNLFRDVLAKPGDRLGQPDLDGMAFENVVTVPQDCGDAIERGDDS